MLVPVCCSVEGLAIRGGLDQVRALSYVSCCEGVLVLYRALNDHGVIMMLNDDHGVIMNEC